MWHSGRQSQLIKLVGVSNSKQYVWSATRAQTEQEYYHGESPHLVIPLFRISSPYTCPYTLHISVDCALSPTEDASLHQC